MDFISIFFIIMSIVTISYYFHVFKAQKRLPIIFEVFYVAVFGFVFLVFLYPNILNIIEDVLGIQSAINFILYLSIFVSYFLVFLLYTEKEKQRQQISKLVREIALLGENKKK